MKEREMMKKEEERIRREMVQMKTKYDRFYLLTKKPNIYSELGKLLVKAPKRLQINKKLTKTLL